MYPLYKNIRPLSTDFSQFVHIPCILTIIVHQSSVALKRGLIVVKIPTNMFCIIPIISTGFFPLITISERLQCAGRRWRAPHRRHIVFRGVIESHIGCPRAYAQAYPSNVMDAVATHDPAENIFLFLYTRIKNQLANRIFVTTIIL